MLKVKIDKTKIFAFGLLIATMIILIVKPALAHQPHFYPMSKWMEKEGRHFQLGGWYGDGIFTTDPVRIVLKDNQDAIIGASSLASAVASFCPRLDDCWGFTFQPFHFIPQVWRIDITLPLDANPAISLKDYPEYWHESEADPVMFEEYSNPLLWPVAWVFFSIQHPLELGILTVLSIIIYLCRALDAYARRQSQITEFIYQMIGYVALAISCVIYIFIVLFYGQATAAFIGFALVAGFHCLKREWLPHAKQPFRQLNS